MSDWNDVVVSNVNFDDLGEDDWFNDSEEEAKYLNKSKAVFSNNIYINTMEFSEIYKRIEDQSYNYSKRNKSGQKGKLSSILLDTDKHLYIPLYNYFEKTIKWVKVNLCKPIKITKKYNFSSTYTILNKDEMMKKVKQHKLSYINKDSLNNIDFYAKNIKSENEINDNAIYIADEQLYAKRIYFILNFSRGEENIYAQISLEGALSTRGNNILRTDEHGNNFFKEIVFSNRYFILIIRGRK